MQCGLWSTASEYTPRDVVGVYRAIYLSTECVCSVVYCTDTVRMAGYANSELADMIMCYGEARGNGRRALRIYRQRFPHRRHPHHTMFARLHQRLRDTGSLRPQHTGAVQRNVRTPAFDEEVLQRVDNEPSTSTRAIASTMGTSQSTISRVMREYCLHAYHLQKVQALGPDDFAPRVHYVRWVLQRCIANPGFTASILFSDEACFTRDGYFNARNSHIWAVENPHARFIHGHQVKFSVNIWAGIVGNCVLGPVIMPPRLNGAAYLDFLQNTLPLVMEDVPLAIRRELWFQHDGAPAHFSRAVREHLNNTYRECWIGRGGHVAWPPRSPDLTPMDFFLWGHVKSVVYSTPVATRQELVERIFAAFDQLRQTPDILAGVRQSLLRRCTQCNVLQGGHFEHLL